MEWYEIIGIAQTYIIANFFQQQNVSIQSDKIKNKKAEQNPHKKNQLNYKSKMQRRNLKSLLKKSKSKLKTEKMKTIQITSSEVGFSDPFEPVIAEPLKGESKESYSIEVSGQGQLTGLSYTIPAHTEGKIKAKLQISALTSEDVKSLNALAIGMLDASYKEQVKEFEKTSASASLSVWSWFFGGGGASASYEKTKETMKSKGLTETQITMLMDAFLERAKNMSVVEIDFYVNNSANDYSVSGDLYLYTVSGSIQTEKGTSQYRMLADSASAGGPPPAGGGAPSSGNIIKLN